VQCPRTAAQAATARLVRPLLAPRPAGSERHAIAGLINLASSGQPLGLQAVWVELLDALNAIRQPGLQWG